MEDVDAETLRGRMLDGWERQAAGWGRSAQLIRDQGMPVSVRMIDGAGLGPGQTVLELAAGPGDTGFLAAEQIRPGGRLISSDGTEAMLAVARERAAAVGLAAPEVEFRQLQLEWIDLPTATVDRVLCRWGVMLTVDPAAAVREIRRVLIPGGRAAIAVWDLPERNPWATIPNRAASELGHLEPPAPGAPGMFALAEPGRLAELLADAGFTGVELEAVAVLHTYATVPDYLADMRDRSRTFADASRGLADGDRRELDARIAELLAPHTAADGTVSLPGSSLVAVADA